MKNCNEDNDAETYRQKHSRCSDCLRALVFIQQLQKKVMGDPCLAREMGFAVSTIKLALNEDLRYHTYKKCKSITLQKRLKEPDKSKKLVNKVKHPVERGTIWFFSGDFLSGPAIKLPEQQIAYLQFTRRPSCHEDQVSSNCNGFWMCLR